jgi:hypothetical protein
MKTAYGPKISFSVALLLLGSFARGQDLASLPAAKAACGPEKSKFEVSLDQGQRPMLNPVSGKAVVYIAQDFPGGKTVVGFTTRVGVDGAWVGANRNRSYFGFMIDPGVRHLCVSGQWSRSTSPQAIALHSLEAKAGETYYFLVRFNYQGAGGILLALEAVDEDEGQFIIQSSKHSTPHPR